MTAKEVSAFLRIPLTSLWRHTKRGKIRGVKVGKHWRYLEADVHAFLQGTANFRRDITHISNQRSYARINCDIPATLTVLLPKKTASESGGSIRNLGEGGAFFTHDSGSKSTKLKVDDPVKIVFNLPGKSA